MEVYICKDAVLLSYCITMSKDVIPDKLLDQSRRKQLGVPVKKSTAKQRDAVTVTRAVFNDSTLEILDGTLEDRQIQANQ